MEISLHLPALWKKRKFLKTYSWNCLFLCLCSLIQPNEIQAQVAPFALSPDWAFGVGGRAVFPSGSFPTSGAPVVSNRNTNIDPSPEASTSITFKDGSVALYSNTVFAYNGASIDKDAFIRSFAADLTCAGSATGGGIAFPDPASPTDAFYLVLANDLTSGSCADRGVHLYRFTGTGNNVVFDAGPTQLSDTNFPGEAITGGTDGEGGYWTILHSKGNTNTFRVWHFTAGGIAAPVEYTIGADVSSTAGTQSYLKISPCQDKIAYHSGGIVVVHPFNRTTGAIGSELLRFTTTGNGTGLEFSPDGKRIFYNGNDQIVYYKDLSTGTDGSVAGSTSWSLQLGTDGNIYTSPSGTALGVIHNANTTPSYSTIPIPNGASLFRGLTNLAWLSPETPTINKSVQSCTVDFYHLFQNYFMDNIGVNASSFHWDFGDGTTSDGTINPSHTYAAGNTYTINVSFEDATCGHVWNASTSVTSCSMPVDWLDISAAQHDGVVNVQWRTAMELGNDYFEVQRSVDGEHFISIGRVKSQGDSKQIRQYVFTDSSMPEGDSYYRIIQRDTDGTETISATAHVHIIPSFISVLPNPSASSFEVLISESTSAIVFVSDVLGRVVYQTSLPEPFTKVSLGEAFIPGTYLLQVITAQGSHTQKIIKQ